MFLFPSIFFLSLSTATDPHLMDLFKEGDELYAFETRAWGAGDGGTDRQLVPSNMVVHDDIYNILF